MEQDKWHDLYDADHRGRCSLCQHDAGHIKVPDESMTRYDMRQAHPLRVSVVEIGNLGSFYSLRPDA